MNRKLKLAATLNRSVQEMTATVNAISLVTGPTGATGRTGPTGPTGATS